MTEPVVINRNNTDKVLDKGQFGKKSKTPGLEFFYPQLSEQNWEKDLVWVGITDLITGFNSMLRRIFMDLRTDYTGDDGVFNEEGWRVAAADFTAGVQRLQDIQDELDMLNDEQSAIVSDDNFSLDDAGVPVTAEAAELVKRMKANNARIKPLKVKKAEIQAKYQAAADKRAAKKAAAESVAGAAA